MYLVKQLFSLITALLVDMLFHPLGTLLAAALLVLHFVVGLSVWWFVAALLAWILVLRLRGWFLASASRAAAEPDRPCGPRKTAVPHQDE